MKPGVKIFISLLINLLFFFIAFTNTTTTHAVGSDGAWISVPDLPRSHVWGSGIITLNNGKVLVTTGFDKNGLTPASELFDPLSRTWTTTGNVRKKIPSITRYWQLHC